MKQRIVALAVVMLAAAVTSFTADTSAADCQWNVVLPLMPSVGTKGHIWDISSTAPSDVWAGGEQRIRVGAKTTRSRPLLAHWDGNDWSVTSVPVPWGWVASIAARSRDEAWATVVNRYGIFLLRWRASGWRVVRRPQELGDDFDITLRREKLWLIGLVGSYIYAADGWRPLTALDQILPDARIVTSRASDEIWRIRNTHEFPGSGRIVRPVSIVERWERTEWVSTPAVRSALHRFHWACGVLTARCMACRYERLPRLPPSLGRQPLATCRRAPSRSDRCIRVRLQKRCGLRHRLDIRRRQHVPAVPAALRRSAVDDGHAADSGEQRRFHAVPGRT
jgi:hypothetical protein